MQNSKFKSGRTQTSVAYKTSKHLTKSLFAMLTMHSLWQSMGDILLALACQTISKHPVQSLVISKQTQTNCLLNTVASTGGFIVGICLHIVVN